jgi:hypothetical protein
MIFYTPSKPNKWGFKIHGLCSSLNGYCYNLYFDKTTFIHEKTV